MQTISDFKNIDEYIAMFPKEIQTKLKQLRQVIKKTAPKAEEVISYRMPTFDMYGKHLVYFAAFKNHIGFFPFPSGVSAFKKETEKYTTSKGTIQFPLDQPIPVALVKKIVKFRIAELTKTQTVKY